MLYSHCPVLATVHLSKDPQVAQKKALKNRNPFHIALDPICRSTNRAGKKLYTDTLEQDKKLYFCDTNYMYVCIDVAHFAERIAFVRGISDTTSAEGL
ncbi:hypothetical protein A3D42_02665 [Candidatus Nomurabacteria bacterium RIFCSPHIGHO2_02_FULL_41_18]|uniref:Uncharacterized protein n=1 Tax=Candidatus Nomurabacteria bacterium RIFCSPHIGHO2_02_FULL_41_18 TaxID=1801754 RepID=A0A1F6W828_9BACT|nr:MAG: hypothetical protein A3D42_02665 [Candidatus Nomurabacteria bacterium RIFCSPHIGHO2_02_FULL_41_18]